MVAVRRMKVALSGFRFSVVQFFEFGCIRQLGMP